MKLVSATSAREIHSPVCSSNTTCGYSIMVQASSGMGPIAALTAVFIGTVTDTSAPAVVAAPMVTWP